jgi:cysteine-rich repeat protein
MSHRCVSFTCAIVLAGCFEPTSNNLGDGEPTSSTGDAPTGSGPTIPGATSESGDATESVGQTESASETEPTDGTGSTDESGGPFCGDGVPEGNEVCDDGVNDGSYGGCSPDCSQLGPRCGDGIHHGAEGEVCDDGDDENGDGCNIDCIESGTVLWTETYSSNIGSSADGATDVDVDDDGTILVVGDMGGAQPAGILLWYDPEGVLLDERTPMVIYRIGRFGGPGYILGESFANEDPVAVAGFDSTHTLAWRRQQGATGVTDIAVDADGDVHVVGYYAPLPGSNRLFRTKLEPDGDVIWEELDDTSDEYVSCSDVAVLPDGASIFQCGTTQWLDADGNQISELDQDLTLLETWNDGSYVGTSGTYVFRFDVAGAEVWTVPGGLSIEDIAIDGSGSVVTAGGDDVGKYGPDGTPLWTATHDADVYAVAIAPDDAIVVAGIQENADDDVWVRKYAP